MGSSEQGADATDNRWLVIPRTLCFVFNGEDVLLMKRSPTRRIFPNQYNGVGGHVERDEDPYQCALREIKEETGLDVHTLTLRGIHNIDAGQQSGIIMFVFTAQSDSRAVIDNPDEGTLHWVPQQQVMQLDLVEDLPQIVPRILTMPKSSPPYHAHVSYDDHDIIQLRFSTEV